MQARIALITGASRGLGKSAALNLARHGRDIVLTYHSQKEEADAVVQSIQAMGRRAVAIELDVSKVANFEAFVARSFLP